MSAFLSTVQGLNDQLIAQAGAVNNSTTEAQWYSRKSVYDTLYSDYLGAQDALVRNIQARSVLVSKARAVDARDPMAWMGGGVLRGATMAGGTMMSLNGKMGLLHPTMPGLVASAVQGNALPALNTSYNKVLSSLNTSRFLDVLSGTIRNVQVVYMSITVLDAGGNVVHAFTDYINVPVEGSGGDSNAFGGVTSSTATPGSLADAHDAHQNSFNALGMLASKDPVGIGLTVLGIGYNIATGKTTSVQGVVGGAVVGSVQAVATQVATQAVMGVIGTVSVGVAIGVGLVVGYVVSQVFAMAMGLDTTFGPGGAYMGTTSTGVTTYAGPGFTQGLIDALPGFVASAFGLTQSLGYGVAGDAFGTGKNDFGFNMPSMPDDFTDPSYGLPEDMGNPFADVGHSIGGNTPGAGASGPSGGDSPGMGSTSGDGFSCFVGGTEVITKDGTKHIENVVIGDYLLGDGGSWNKVLEFDHPKLGNRAVFSINSGRPFVTSEHPFKTTDGWRAISPMTTAVDSPEAFGNLAMNCYSKLAVGDLVHTVHGMETVLKLQAFMMDSSTQLYNFKLGGNNTYYADGYLVHNK